MLRLNHHGGILKQSSDVRWEIRPVQPPMQPGEVGEGFSWGLAHSVIAWRKAVWSRALEARAVSL